jgi:hypothetical protein
MPQGRRRSGFTLVGVVLVLLVAAVCVLGYFTWTLNTKVNEVDAKGKALSVWAANTDSPAEANLASGGLTTWLINVKNTLNEHVQKPVTGANAAHCPTCPHDHHLDPPPPPPW